MSTMNSMEREQKKRQLKRRMIDPGTPVNRPGTSRQGKRGGNEEEIVRRAERKVRKKRLRIVITVILVLAALTFAAYRYIFGHQFTEYTVAWEKKIPAGEGSITEYVRFGDNILKYSRDGASYIDRSGNPVWSLSYELKSPICYVNGDYAAIADQQGNTIYICDKTGCQGEATTILPILRVSVSAYGVAAALVEDSKASYITFFKKDGSDLDWSIKTVMAQKGYLMDVSLSPDGTLVMLTDLYLQDGTLKNRIIFYNFSEFGKNYPDRLVGGFNELADNLCPRVRILDAEHACAFSDGQIAFFSLVNVTSPELVKQLPVEGEIRSISYSDKYVAIVADNPEGEFKYRLDVYKANGESAFSKPFNYPYKKLDIDGEFVFLYNENSCNVYSMTGKERFSGQFDFTVSKITKGSRFDSLLVIGGDTMRELRLK